MTCLLVHCFCLFCLSLLLMFFIELSSLIILFFSTITSIWWFFWCFVHGVKTRMWVNFRRPWFWICLWVWHLGQRCWAWHLLMGKADSFAKTLMLGKIEDRRKRVNRGWAGWMASPTRRTWVWVNSGWQWKTVRPGVLQPKVSERVGHNWVTE